MPITVPVSLAYLLQLLQSMGEQYCYILSQSIKKILGRGGLIGQEEFRCIGMQIQIPTQKRTFDAVMLEQ